MTTQTATQKAAETAHRAADGVRDTASDAVRSARQAANHSLDQAENGLHRLREEVDPLIDNLAAKAQEFASRGISYCAQTSDRARRQFNQAADATSRYVADQPGKAVLMAAAAGAALATAALLLRRRSNRY